MSNQDDFNESELFSGAARAPSRPASGNPLSQYFRVPGLHVTLPTRGMFLPEGSYDETLAGDIPVYPMKAADEYLLRSADALMSGLALEQLVTSCVPNIKVPRQISTPDLDVILLAVRAATYGEKMDIEVTCPKCGHENLFEIDLPSIMHSMTYIEEGDNVVRLSDEVVVTVKPYTMEYAAKSAMALFEETRKLQATEDGSDERRTTMNESFDRMTKVSLRGVVDSVLAVAVPTGIVTNRDQIAEFVNQTAQPWVKKIEGKINDLNQKGIDKHVDATCAKCSHEWRPEIEFDPTSFFGSGS